MCQNSVVISEINSVLHQFEEKQENVEIVNETDDELFWLNGEYIGNVLRNYNADPTIVVEKLLLRPCSAKGDQYASTMYRLLVHFRSSKMASSQVSLIIKTMCQNEMALEKLGEDNYDVQHKEMDMYYRVLPEFKKILQSIGEDPNIFPNTINIDETNDIIIMEDLMEKKYVMPNRIERLDVLHVKMALRKMALLHAPSIVMHAKNPQVFDNFDTGMFNRKTNALNIFFQTNFEALCHLVSTWEDHQYYAEKLKKMIPGYCENATRAFDSDEGDLAVLCHGDFWTNNTLYKYDENGQPIDVIIIDFQYCVFASPALDLLYFLHNSTKDHIREHMVDELIQYYYYELVDALKKMKYDLDLGNFPSLHQFQMQVLKKMFYALNTSLVVLPVMINEDTKDADFESLVDDGERGRNFKKRIYQNEKFHKIAKQMLPVLDRKGILDLI